jgi:iron complex outermembrane receptor protein
MFINIFRLAFLVLLIEAFVLLSSLALAKDIPEDSNELKELSLDDLMEMEITSVSKRAEPLFDSAAAVYVITGDDIRRSGFNSIAEALRMVPGLQVAQKTSSLWAITSRGFNDQFSNKLLVMIDGRPIYTPIFSGVFWGSKDLVLEDIERIEVIRGPGAALWGANAVNGVISIISKNSKKTQDGLVSAVVGNQDQAIGSIRYGGSLGDLATYRVFGKMFKRDDFADETGAGAFDEWKVARGGFRIDWDPNEKDSFFFDGDYYKGDLGNMNDTVPISFSSPLISNETNRDPIKGGHFLVSWVRTLEGGSEFKTQFFYDREERDIENISDIKLDRFDFDFQHRFFTESNHEIIWGVNNRTISDKFGDSFSLAAAPNKRIYNNFSFFVQDRLELVQDFLSLTVGSKFTLNRFSGFEIQPNIRFALTPDRKNTFWGAVSRAARTPSRTEDGDLSQARVRATNTSSELPLFVTAFGSNDYKSEKLTAYELGYRTQFRKDLFLDVVGFFNHYDDLRFAPRGTSFLDTSSTPHLVLPIFLSNSRNEDTYGVEISSQWEVLDFWKLNASFTWFEASSEDIDGNAPDTQWQVRSYLDLPYEFEFDFGIYFVDDLSGQNISDYTRLDARLGWKPMEKLELSLVGQNLQDPEHSEFLSGTANNFFKATQVQRSVFGKLTLQF